MTATDIVGLSLVGQLEKILRDIQSHNFPPLTIITIPDDPDLSEDDDDYTEAAYLLCPWHDEGDADAYDDEFVVVDFDYRHNQITYDEDDAEAKRLWVSYGDTEHDTLYLLHTTCGKPVSAPADHDVDWN